MLDLQTGGTASPLSTIFQFFILTLFELVGEDTDPPELQSSFLGHLPLARGGANTSPLTTKV